MSKFIDNKVSKLPKLPTLPTLPKKTDMTEEYRRLLGTKDHKRGEITQEQPVSIIAKEEEEEDPRLKKLQETNPSPNNAEITSCITRSNLRNGKLQKNTYNVCLGVV